MLIEYDLILGIPHRIRPRRCRHQQKWRLEHAAAPSGRDLRARGRAAGDKVPEMYTVAEPGGR